MSRVMLLSRKDKKLEELVELLSNLGGNGDLSWKMKKICEFVKVLNNEGKEMFSDFAAKIWEEREKRIEESKCIQGIFFTDVRFLDIVEK